MHKTSISIFFQQRCILFQHPPIFGLSRLPHIHFQQRCILFQHPPITHCFVAATRSSSTSKQGSSYGATIVVRKGSRYASSAAMGPRPHCRSEREPSLGNLVVVNRTRVWRYVARRVLGARWIARRRCARCDARTSPWAESSTGRT
jgi:hypothetical protein